MNSVAILDFGSQYTQLITRRLRELNVYSEIFPHSVSLEVLKEFSPKAIILSGGPASVLESGSPNPKVQKFREISPVLGLCYGMQLIAKQLGGTVIQGKKREYGLTQLNWQKNDLNDFDRQFVWMSHGDTVEKVPDGFIATAKTESGLIAAMEGQGYFGFQFHPEVTHTQNGDFLLQQFLRKCNITFDWKSENIFEKIKTKTESQISNNNKILCALSGGVDSSVLGVFLTRIFGKERVRCIFVNNGLLRKNEYEEVMAAYESLGLNVQGVDASNKFLTHLKNITDPERKRKIIGETFIQVFEENCPKDFDFLAQGTLYPDVIESVSINGGHVTIKSHHNVGGLPEKMNLKLLEPFRELFKDEVRELGAYLEIPKDILKRHPFPGPGLAVRILGEVNNESLEILRECDSIFIQELKSSGYYNQVWQAFCVLLPIYTVGVQGDSRSYERTLALRAVTSQDGMTADWFMFPLEFLKRVSTRITNEVKKVNRVVYDISSKPPSTIEWE